MHRDRVGRVQLDPAAANTCLDTGLHGSDQHTAGKAVTVVVLPQRPLEILGLTRAEDVEARARHVATLAGVEPHGRGLSPGQGGQRRVSVARVVGDPTGLPDRRGSKLDIDAGLLTFLYSERDIRLQVARSAGTQGVLAGQQFGGDGLARRLSEHGRRPPLGVHAHPSVPHALPGAVRHGERDLLRVGLLEVEVLRQRVCVRELHRRRRGPVAGSLRHQDGLARVATQEVGAGASLGGYLRPTLGELDRRTRRGNPRLARLGPGGVGHRLRVCERRCRKLLTVVDPQRRRLRQLRLRDRGSRCVGKQDVVEEPAAGEVEYLTACHQLELHLGVGAQILGWDGHAVHVPGVCGAQGRLLVGGIDFLDLGVVEGEDLLPLSPVGAHVDVADVVVVGGPLVATRPAAGVEPLLEVHGDVGVRRQIQARRGQRVGGLRLSVIVQDGREHVRAARILAGALWRGRRLAGRLRVIE